MSKRFTEKAEKALNVSVEIAEKMGHTYIGTEHLLLSLLSDKDSCSAFILGKHGITYSKLEDIIKEYSGIGSPTSLTVKDITPRGRAVLEASYGNAIKFDNGVIGTDHVLLALIEEKGSVALKLIRMLGSDASEIRNEVVSFLKGKEKKTTKNKGEATTQMLSQYGINMTENAKRGLYDPVIERDIETDRIIRIISRKNKNNPCLIGEAGVGKTAIIEGLATRIANNDVPESIKGKTIISIDLTSMVAGAKYRGDFEERIKSIIKEASDNKNIILFIDEIHTIVGAGAAEGAIDASNILKPQLSRGEIQLIGATTLNEYHRYIEKDPALERRFQPIKIEEPSKEATYSMLLALKERYEKHHNVVIEDEAIKRCIDLSVKYMSDRFLPDKALDLMDEACAYVNSKSKGNKIVDCNDKTRQIKSNKELAIKQRDFELALEYKELEDIFSKDKTVGATLSDLEKPIVRGEDVSSIVSEIYGIKKSRIDSDAGYESMSIRLKSEIKGQDQAIDTIINTIKRNELGLVSYDRPKGIFMLTGESGVGKTALASKIADLMLVNSSSFIRLDMSEYSENHSVSKLIGSPPGYVGSEEGGRLTEAVRRNPYSVILLDEIDKADKDVINLFLQIFDYGTIKDSLGKQINFRNTLIFMTSNVYSGTSLHQNLGFIDNKEKYGGNSYELLKTKFKSEFLSRIDEVIELNTLSREDLKEIALMHLSKLRDRLSEMGAIIEIEDGVADFIAVNSYVSKQGARPIIRYIHTQIEKDLTNLILKRGQIGEIKIILRVDGGRLTVSDVTLAEAK